MTKWLCGWIWWLSEFSGIGLGRFAPWVFGKSIGCKYRLDKIGGGE